MTDLIPQFSFGNPQGQNTAKRPLSVHVSRPLTLDDIPDIEDCDKTIPVPQHQLKKITHAHHNLARLMAKGEPDNMVALITGYSKQYIWKIKGDPAFQDLLEYYSSQTREIFVDVLERMRSLGLSTIDELQDRLAEEPEKFSNRELMEMTKLLLIDPQRAGQGSSGGGGGAPSTSINIKFVSAQVAAGPETAKPVGPIVHLDADEYDPI